MTFCNRRRARTAALSLVVAAVFLAGSLPRARVARAQGTSRAGALTEAQKKNVKEHYEKANRFYLIGKYPEAIAEFEAAYLIGADPVMIYNIAQSYRLNSQPEEAARFYRNYLRSAPEATNRAEVEKKIAEMDKLAAEKRQAASAPAPVERPATPAPVTVPAPVTGAPGPSSGPPTQPPPWSPGAAPPPGGEPAGVVGATAPAVERPSRGWPLALMIGGGVLVTTSLLLGGAAASKAKEVEKRASPGNLPFDADTKKLETDGKVASAAAVVFGLAGLAVGGVGLFWWLRAAPAEASASGATSPSATSSVFPLAGPGLYGAGARVAF